MTASTAREDIGKVVKLGGWRLFNYHTSLPRTLEALYPDVKWEAEKFRETSGKVPSGHWQDRKNLLPALEKAERILKITQVLLIQQKSNPKSNNISKQRLA